MMRDEIRKVLDANLGGVWQISPRTLERLTDELLYVLARNYLPDNVVPMPRRKAHLPLADFPEVPPDVRREIMMMHCSYCGQEHEAGRCPEVDEFLGRPPRA